MRVVAISDTHKQHPKITLPPGDLLIHAGDCSGRGKPAALRNFLEWFAAQPHRYKIFIAGNHDFLFEEATEEEINTMIPREVIYLNDSGVEIEGLKIWGSPIQPWFFNWAFNRHRGAEIKKHWDLIPENTDILITHGPPMGILDQTTRGEAAGCLDLMNKINTLKLKCHIFGHIHEAYGVVQQGGTTFINASLLDQKYKIRNKPVVIDL